MTKVTVFIVDICFIRHHYSIIQFYIKNTKIICINFLSKNNLSVNKIGTYQKIHLLKHSKHIEVYNKQIINHIKPRHISSVDINNKNNT